MLSIEGLRYERQIMMKRDCPQAIYTLPAAGMLSEDRRRMSKLLYFVNKIVVAVGGERISIRTYSFSKERRQHDIAKYVRSIANICF